MVLWPYWLEQLTPT